jgi:hypothetical protein
LTDKILMTYNGRRLQISKVEYLSNHLPQT